MLNHVDSVLNINLLHFTLNFTLGALEESVTLYYATSFQERLSSSVGREEGSHARGLGFNSRDKFCNISSYCEI